MKTLDSGFRRNDVIYCSMLPPGRRPYPPACKPYGLEAGPEAMPYAPSGP